jgi:hypothetical protein
VGLKNGPRQSYRGYIVWRPHREYQYRICNHKMVS